MIARLPATAAAFAVLCMFGATAIIAAHHPAARFLVVVPLAATMVWVLFVMLAALLTVLAIVMLGSWNWARLKRRAASGK